MQTTTTITNNNMSRLIDKTAENLDENILDETITAKPKPDIKVFTPRIVAMSLSN